MPTLNPSMSATVQRVRTDHLYSRRNLCLSACAASVASFVVIRIIVCMPLKSSQNSFVGSGLSALLGNERESFSRFRQAALHELLA